MEGLTVVFKLAKLPESIKGTPGQKKALEALNTFNKAMLLKLVKRSNESIVEGGVSYYNFFDYILNAYEEYLLALEDGSVEISDMGDFADEMDAVFGEATIPPPTVKKVEPKPVVAEAVKVEAKVVEAVIEEKKETSAEPLAEEAVEAAVETAVEGGERGGYRGNKPRGNYRGNGE
jgi:hypothetical protein